MRVAALVVLVTLSAISMSSALKCQVYDGSSKTDNGVDTECASDQDACTYSSEDTTKRACGKAPDGKAGCADVGTGVKFSLKR